MRCTLAQVCTGSILRSQGERIFHKAYMPAGGLSASFLSSSPVSAEEKAAAEKKDKEREAEKRIVGSEAWCRDRIAQAESILLEVANFTDDVPFSLVDLC